MAPRVLVVDDSPVTAQLLTQALRATGLEADAATSVSDLGDHLARHEYALVLVDVNMPEVYGDDVVEFLRVQRKISARLFLYSDLPEPELASRAQAVGADGYVAKSSGLEHAVAAVRAGLGEPAAATRRVLLCDADEAAAVRLAAELVAAGLEVTTAASADAARRLVLNKKTRPSLVLLDVQAPGVDAAAFCRMLKDNSLFAGIRCFLCSSGDETGLRRLAQASGADGALRKGASLAAELAALLR